MRIQNFIVPVAALALAVTSNLHAQEPHGICGVFDPIELLERVTGHQQTLADMPVAARSSQVKYVPVRFILVANSEGSGRVREEQVLAQLAAMNEQFAAQQMIFYISDSLKYMNNTNVYNDPNLPASVFQMRINRSNKALNIFIVNQIPNLGNTVGTILGRYNFVEDWIEMIRSEVNATSGTASHEIGHFFSLSHPHSGWECDPYDEAKHGNPVSFLFTPCHSQLQVEFANGTNCTLSGDRICDTPPDYNFGSGWNVGGDRCAEFTLQIMDPNGDVVNPMENNIMGYFIGCSAYVFTPDQMAIVQADYLSFKRAYIRSDYVPVQDPVDEQVLYNYPINGEETPTFNYIELNWEDVPNATHYLVIVDRSQGFGLTPQRFIVQESSLTIESLLQNVNYFWRVWPYNESQTGAGWSATQNFRTGTASSVQTIPYVERFDVFPNPVAAQHSLNILIQSGKTFDAFITLHDLTGRVISVKEKETIVADSEHHIAIVTGGMPAGMYILRVQSADGLLSRRVTIF